MKNLSVSVKVAILGVFIAVIAIIVPLLVPVNDKEKSKSIQENISSTAPIVASDQSVVIQGNSGTVTMNTETKNESKK